MQKFYPLIIQTMIDLILKGRIPSKKNQKQRTGRRLVSSKAYQERESEQLKALLNQNIKPRKLKDSYSIEYTFYLPDARKTDLSNKIESINDLFVKFWLFEDDNREIIREMHVRAGWIDRDNPRCEIRILTMYIPD